MKRIYFASTIFIMMLFLASCQSKGKYLFVLSGQSNMAGLNPKTSFIPALEAKYGKENIIVVKDAKGGQPIRRWYKNWENPIGEKPKVVGDLYDRLLKKVNDSIKNKKTATVTFIWMQGERDARMKFSSFYEESLLGLYQQLQEDLKEEKINMIIGRLSDFDMQNKKYAHWTKIRDIQLKIGESKPNFSWINTDDLNTGLNNKGNQVTDDLHLTITGYKILGDRFAEKAIEIIENK